MTSEREPILPLATGLIVALLVHLVMLPVFTSWLTELPITWSRRRLVTDHLKPILPDPNQIKLGRDSPKVSSIAWISHDDFRKLLAPKSQTEQPALQQQADPVAHAPITLDPTPGPPPVPPTPTTPPTPPETAPETAAATPAKPSPKHVLQPRRQETPQSPLELAELILDGQITAVVPGNPRSSKPIKRSNNDPPTPAQRRAPTRSAQKPARPTAASRSDKESTPVTLHISPTVRPGGVLVGEGIEIKTTVPRLGIAARRFAIPHNPIAKLIFDHRDGRVIQATLVTSTGYPDWDGPIEASLYQWRASGRRLTELDRPLELKIKLIFISE